MQKTEKASLKKPLLLLFVILGIPLIATVVIDKTNQKMAVAPLNKSHQNIEKCDTCHQPLQEVRAINCAKSNCHTASFFRKRMKQTDSPLVQHIRHKECVDCHSDHIDENTRITKSINHSEISKDRNCTDCHMLPDIHAPAEDKNCIACHEIKSFKTANISN